MKETTVAEAMAVKELRSQKGHPNAAECKAEHSREETQKVAKWKFLCLLRFFAAISPTAQAPATHPSHCVAVSRSDFGNLDSQFTIPHWRWPPTKRPRSRRDHRFRKCCHWSRFLEQSAFDHRLRHHEGADGSFDFILAKVGTAIRLVALPKHLVDFFVQRRPTVRRRGFIFDYFHGCMESNLWGFVNTGNSSPNPKRRADKPGKMVFTP